MSECGPGCNCGAELDYLETKERQAQPLRGTPEHRAAVAEALAGIDPMPRFDENPFRSAGAVKDSVKMRSYERVGRIWLPVPLDRLPDASAIPTGETCGCGCPTKPECEHQI